MTVRKRRTREHVLEDLSENHLERVVLERGHLLRRPSRDYGIDVSMFHFAPSGEIENGEVKFQLKSSEKLNRIQNGVAISIPIQTNDLHYWSMELLPVILVAYDASEDKAYWVDVQDYVRLNSSQIDFERNSSNIHISSLSVVDAKSIDLFRMKSLAVANERRKLEGFDDE